MSHFMALFGISFDSTPGSNVFFLEFIVSEAKTAASNDHPLKDGGAED